MSDYSPILYVVGTPIGNLNDMTFRAISTLKEVDFIAAEDTRVTAKLLNHFEIKKPMISYHEHNLRERGEYIVSRILGGEICAIVSDAGMPCISDPGEDLVRLCAENDICIKVIPGPSAAISGLAISGLKTSRFTFEGFLSTSKTNRFNHLKELAEQQRTMIFYEAPHKLLATLNDLFEQFGDRKISVTRELTKMFEQVLRMTLSEAIEYYNTHTPKGEFVLIIEGKAADIPKDFTLEQAVKKAEILLNKGEKATDAARQAAKETGFRKSDIYNQLSKLSLN